MAACASISPRGGLETGEIVVLRISPFDEDRLWLERAFQRCNWKLHHNRSVAPALASARRDRIPIILCDGNLEQGSWRDILDAIARWSDPPLLIVTSRLADDYLWAEALNLGAYDVLAKPFDHEELYRVVSLAGTQAQRRRKHFSKNGP
jgi:DNA-binding response OmpR family regulator